MLIKQKFNADFHFLIWSLKGKAHLTCHDSLQAPKSSARIFKSILELDMCHYLIATKKSAHGYATVNTLKYGIPKKKTFNNVYLLAKQPGTNCMYNARQLISCSKYSTEYEKRRTVCLHILFVKQSSFIIVSFLILVMVT